MTETKKITAQDVIRFCERSGLELPSFTVIEVIAENGEKTTTNPLLDIFERLIAIQQLIDEIDGLSERENARRYEDEILPKQNELEAIYPVLATSSLARAGSKSSNLSMMLKYVRDAMEAIKS